MPTEPHPRETWGYIMTAVWVAAAFVISAFFAIGFCIGWYGIDRLDEIFAALQSDPNAAFNGVLISQIYMSSAVAQIAVLAIAIRARAWPITKYLALDIPQLGTTMRALALLLIVIACLDGITTLMGNNPASQFQVTSYNTAKEAGVLPFLFVVVVLVAPVTEEIIFRGFLYRGFARTPGSEPYVVVIISLAFAAAHYSQYNATELATVFVIGLLFGLVRWRSGSTTLTMLMHVVANFVATVETVVYIEWLSK